MSNTTLYTSNPSSSSKVPSTQEISPELSSAAKKVSPERRSRESESSSVQQQTKESLESIENSSSSGALKRTSPSVITGQGSAPYSDYNKVYTLSPPERRDYSIFPSTPQYDPTLLDISEPLSPFFRSSPRVTPSRYIPSGPSNRSCLPPPKYNMNPTGGEHDSIRHVAEESVKRRSGGGGGGDGLDQIIRASESTEFECHPAIGRIVNKTEEMEEEMDNSSPPRESTLRHNGKVTVVSPPEGDVSSRKGTTTNPSSSRTRYDLPNVPDSPYGPPGVYPPYQHGVVPYYPHPAAPPHGYPYPPSFHRNATHTPDGIEGMDHDRYHQYYYGPPYGYGYDRPLYEADMYRGTSSLGKRKRMQDQPQDDREHDMEHEVSENYGGMPPRPYYDQDRQPYRYYRPPVSESFESSSDSGSKQRRTRVVGAAPITKAPSYPPPPSPNRYGMEGAESSAASYPGARRSSEHGYNGSSIHHPSRLAAGGPPTSSSYGNVVRYPTRYEDGQGYPPPQDLYSRPSRGYAGPHTGGYVEGSAHYFPSGKTSPVQKTLLRSVHSEDIHASPLSSATKQHFGPNAPPPSPKDGGSPSKAKASTTAQAAIAAGMTEPSSAKEVDFDITAPPSEPVTPASTHPICTSSSELNEDDVLCGRGGGTNTQIGNRKFRSLVQEFQPTYLLCRRKEKPQIARTIVLIIRKRGGRFLKKNEDDGTYLEVGDEKAEAKTCQALREGLDVRATKSTIDGRKKSGRPRNMKKETLPDGRGADTVHFETESPRRDGPPPPYYEVFPYAPPPPPPYYYGAYDPYYAPPPFDVATSPHSYSPRKRVTRLPPPSTGDAPYASGDYQHYHPTTPYKHHGYQYLPEQHPSQREFSREEANAMTWEMEFSPPRSSIVKK